MPDTVTEIGEGAFESCSSLRSLLILNHQTGAKLGPAEYNTGSPEHDAVYLGGVSTIGREAFSSCTSIQIVDFDSDDTTNVNIGSNAFSACTSLMSVTVPKGSLGTGVFSSCHSLSHIAFHDSYTEIPGNILSGIENPLTIEFPSSLKRIGSGACAGNIILDMNLNKRPNLSFAGVTSSVTKVVIPTRVKFDGKAYRVTGVSAKACYNNRTITKVTIGKNVTSVGSKAFYGCVKLKTVNIKSKRITNNIGSIG